MDSIRTLMDKKEYDLVIKITENAKDANDIFYRITAFLALGKADESLECIKQNGRLLEKSDLALVIKMHIEILCVLQRFDEAYEVMDHYENLPYESQVVEETLKEYKKFIRESEKESYKTTVMSQDEILKRLDSDNAPIVLDALQSIRQFNVNIFLTKIERILTNFPLQSVRSFALMLLVDQKVNKVVRFKHMSDVIEVNPSELVPPFVDEEFVDFVNLVQNDFKDPTLSENAINFYSSYLIYSYPDACTFDKSSLLCALYGLSLEYLQSSGNMSLIDKCKDKNVDIREVTKIMNILRDSIEII